LVKRKTDFLPAAVANRKGEIFELEGYAATGMAGNALFPLGMAETLPIPHGGELMFLPDRSPILYNIATGRFETLTQNPHKPEETLYPVAAFNSPGYVAARITAYAEREGAGFLPLFSYGAVGIGAAGFRAAVIQVDRERRQDLRLMRREDVTAGVNRMRKRLPGNRLREHLEKCALQYGCPAGKNFFLGRYEAPLPTSRSCNARCIGCISLQAEGEMPSCQDRIGFTPTPEEISGVALEHIGRVDRAVVSFGQGCEGDPLFAAGAIEPAIRLIRSRTDRGTINMNTNASLPDILDRLWEAGLDSMRVSLNSVRPECYEAYFRPRGYGLPDVFESIERGLARGKLISVNYLNMPGFTDSPEEADALCAFLSRHPIHLIQWRNLNFDPRRYWDLMNRVSVQGAPIGMDRLIGRIRKRFPAVRFGYFNPSKEKYRNSGDRKQS
jgi:pyruvate-formate lyase-activating enzyme